MRMADYLQTNMALLYPDGTSKLFTCATPNYKSSMNSIIRNHVESVKKQKTILTCEICDFTCRYKNSMKKHVASAHKENNSNESIMVEEVYHGLSLETKTDNLVQSGSYSISISSIAL